MINNPGNKFNRLVLASVMAMAFGLSGCGGSSGGGPDTDDSITNVTVGGTVSKGIVNKGVVTADELNASGGVVATVGSTATGVDGSYSLTLNNDYNGGPIQISITVGADTETKCDVPAGCGTRTDGLSDSDSIIDFGEWYKPAAFTMTALIPGAESNETLSVSVTPFTHMAAARALESSTLDATAIANANSEVSNLLNGIDILNTAPVDITDLSGTPSATQITYAALASALSNQGLIDGNGQPKLNETINLLASSFITGVIEADDSDGDDAVQISLQEIVTAAEETFIASGIIDLTGTLAGLQAGIDFAEDGDGTINPEPSTTVADANLVKVKAMVSDIRTWGNVIAAETEARGSAFDAQVTLASDAISIFGTDNLFNALDAGLEAAFNFTSGTTDISAYDLGLNTFDSGTIDSTTPGEITISAGVVHGYTVDMVINLPEDESSGTSFSLGVTSATISSTNNVMTINNGVVNVTFAEEFFVDYADIEDPLTTVVLPVTTDLTFDLDVAFTQNVDSSGAELASPVSFAGTLSFDLDVIPVINNPAEDSALPKTLYLSGVISNTLGDSVTASLAANITNTATFEFVGDFAPLGTLYSENHTTPLISWSYPAEETFVFVTPNSTRTFVRRTDGFVDITKTKDGVVVSTKVSENSFESITDFATIGFASKGGRYPYIENEGTYFASYTGLDFSKAGSGDGILVDVEFVVESSSNWIEADIGLTFVAQLAGLPEARINITAERTAFEAGDGTVTISYGNRQLALTASATATGVDSDLTITNQDNVEMILSLAGTDTTLLNGDLNYNGVKYADVEETASGYLKVSYTDGTFEIF